jgi:Zn-dependent peptidase ImmA (M78 family)
MTIKKWILRFSLPLLALVVFGLTQVLIRYPFIAEQYYSQQIYPVLASVLSSFSRWFPFSLADLFYLLLILAAVIVVFLLIIKKISFSFAGLFVLNALAVVYISFYLLWGFNYFRSDINTRLEINTQYADTEEFITVLRQIVEATNASWHSYGDFSESKTDSLVENSFRRLAPALKLKYPMGSRRSKTITFSGFFAQAGISGYYGPFFNEIHINRYLLPAEYAFVLAHEKAHQFGITGEAEANFIAWMVCTHSESGQLQYAANLVALRYFLNHAARYEQLPEIIKTIDDRVIEDIREIHRHWMNLRNEKVERVASKVNDAYLKTNQVEQGIRDYTGIVKHIMDYSLDSAFRESVAASSLSGK